MKLDFKKMKVLGVFLLGALSLSSCLNNDDELPIPEDASFVAFHNVSPNSNGLKFSENGNLINTNSANYGQFFGYANLTPGQSKITVQSGTSSDLDTLNINLIKDKNYSVFAVNRFEDLELVAYEDQFTNPNSPLKTLFRFIQLSPDAPTVVLKIEGNNEDFGQYFFKQASGYREIEEVLGKNIYLIDVETNDTILSKSINLTRGKTYSIFSKGFVNTTNPNQKIDIQIIPIN